MDGYRFTVRQQDETKNYTISRSQIEAEYGPLEGMNYLFYSAGSNGKLLSLEPLLNDG